MERRRRGGGGASRGEGGLGAPGRSVVQEPFNQRLIGFGVRLIGSGLFFSVSAPALALSLALYLYKCC